jgi:hypothetical protein
MTEEAAPLPEGFLRVSPLDVLVVGDPPVSVRAVAQASQRQRAEEEPASAACRAYPGLSVDQVRAALKLSERDPDQLRVNVGLLDAASLALPHGLGLLLFTVGFVAVLGETARLVLSLVGGAGGSPVEPSSAPKALLKLAVVAIALGVGIGLQRLARWGQYGGAALGGVQILFLVGLVLMDVRVESWAPLPLSVCCLLLLHGKIGRWFTPEGRAASSALPLKGFRDAVAWLALVTAGLFFVVPAFRRMFEEVGIHLPWGTEMLLEAAAMVRNYGLLVPLLLIFAPAPLLTLDWKHERTIRAAAWTAGLAAFGAMSGWLFLPLFELMEKL